MRVIVNGEPRDLPENATVADLVLREARAGGERAGGEGAGGRGLAVAVDAEVVPRSLWEATRLEDGQRVEMLTAIQGGAA